MSRPFRLASQFCIAIRRGPFLSVALAALLSMPAAAETMSDALRQAYRNSPDINQQRAAVRAIDENTPKAKAGYLPKVNANGFLGEEYDYERGQLTSSMTGATGGLKTHAAVRGYTGKVTETVFDGFKTLNSVRQAESQTFAARETLRGTEQNVLLGAATAYMNVLRDSAIVELRRNNVIVLTEQLRQIRSRFQAGEVTTSDVAQTQASLAQGRSDFAGAQSALLASTASFRLYVGVEPDKLAPAKPLDPLLPRDLDAAISIGLAQHPLIVAARHNVAVALSAVKVAEAALYPTASLVGEVDRLLDYDGFTSLPGYKSFDAFVGGQAVLPVYQGGAEYAAIRQAKEQVRQAELALDSQGDAVRAQIVAAWNGLDAARAEIQSGRAAEAAAERALSGMRDEAIAGQRTTYDVLTAQQTLLSARVGLVTAQRDRIVASYGTLAAIGGLNPDRLRLDGPRYDPAAHYRQVENKFIGTSTPDGR